MLATPSQRWQPIVSVSVGDADRVAFISSLLHSVCQPRIGWDRPRTGRDLLRRDQPGRSTDRARVADLQATTREAREERNEGRKRRAEAITATRRRSSDAPGALLPDGAVADAGPVRGPGVGFVPRND
jgi:hypothetical protein